MTLRDLRTKIRITPPRKGVEKIVGRRKNLRQDFITTTTVLSKKGHIVLPNTVREQMHLEPGQDFEVLLDDENTILLRRISQPPNQGLVDHLLSCPIAF